EEDKSNRAARAETGSQNVARGLNHHRCIAAVVERPGAKLPGIQMRAEQQPFVGFLPAANFRDHILLFHGATNAVRNSQPHADALTSGEEMLQPQGVLARHNRLWKVFDLS